MYGQFDDKTAFITGVAKKNGIGWAVAKAPGEAWIKPGITDISDMVHEQVKELYSEGCEVTSWVADLRSPESVQSAADEFIERYKRADILQEDKGPSKLYY